MNPCKYQHFTSDIRPVAVISFILFLLSVRHTDGPYLDELKTVFLTPTLAQRATSLKIVKSYTYQRSAMNDFSLLISTHEILSIIPFSAYCDLRNRLRGRLLAQNLVSK